MAHRELIGTTTADLAAAEAIAGEWDALGLAGHFLARDLQTGAQLGFDADRPTPLASVAKVPIALVALEAIAAGRIDGAARITVDPAASAAGPTGVAAFAHPARIAVADLVMLMLTVSDNASADHLLELAGIAEVDAALAGWGRPEIRLRHRFQTLFENASRAGAGDTDLALELAIASEGDAGFAIELLDPALGNVGTARALVGLLQDIWADRISVPAATRELRRLMRLQVFTQRLSADLRSDAIRVAGKTGTFLHLRHEIGVVESVAGTRVAIAALTRSSRPASVAADLDLAIGAAARVAFETLRDGA